MSSKNVNFEKNNFGIVKLIIEYQLKSKFKFQLTKFKKHKNYLLNL